MTQPFHLDSSGAYRVPAFLEFPWLEHGFGTRAATSWPDPSRLALLKQIHSTTVIEAKSPGWLGQGDALTTNVPGLLTGIRTADCVPILLVDSRNRAVAAVHAGWRGTAGRIAAATAAEMGRLFGTSPTDLHAAIGPAIGECCYEVGPEVARRFAPWWPALESIDRPAHLDLVETNRRQLQEAGIPRERIFTGAVCTCCTGTLHSFRRDKDAAGRMISAIGIRLSETAP